MGMDEMCRLMRATEKLEAEIEASTERFFVLADKVKDQRAVLHSYVELQKSTETLLSKQMGIIRSVRTEVKLARKQCAEASKSTDSLKLLHKHLKAIEGE